LHTLIDKAVANYGAALSNQKVAADVSDFIFDRYRAIYQGEGVDTNTVVAVQNALQNAGGAPHNPYDVALRIAAVESFSQLPEAEALSAANKRVQNILAKQQGTEPAGAVNPQLLEAAEEQSLHTQLVDMASAVPALCTQQRYTEALRQLAGLRCAIDNFFDHVMVMDENPELRKNRINLLAELNALFMGIADISQLQNRAAG
jgi:glycyl-tRNA synthetase beta chain